MWPPTHNHPQEFLREDSLLRERMQELSMRGDRPEKQEAASIKQACDFQAKRIDRITKEFRTMIDIPRRVITDLGKKK
eukprot:m.46877 g.46877  ORF g.46877 m.46877 type:complete len:78 (+) comp15528_c0_seq1:167-400(+)